MFKRSKFEEVVQKQVGRLPYEARKFKYIIEKNYIPDWTDSKHKIIVEAKGKFTPGDRTKMKAVKAAWPDWTIIMVLQRPENKLSKASKTTYADWCNKNGIIWTSVENLKETLKNVKTRRKKDNVSR